MAPSLFLGVSEILLPPHSWSCRLKSPSTINSAFFPLSCSTYCCAVFTSFSLVSRSCLFCTVRDIKRDHNHYVLWILSQNRRKVIWLNRNFSACKAFVNEINEPKLCRRCDVADLIVGRCVVHCGGADTERVLLPLSKMWGSWIKVYLLPRLPYCLSNCTEFLSVLQR